MNCLQFELQPYSISFSSLFTKIRRLVVCSFEKHSPNCIHLFEQNSISNTYDPVQSIICQYPQSAILFSPTGFYSEEDSFISSDIELNVYHINDGIARLIQTFSKGNDYPITCIDWSKEETYLQVLCCSDGTAILYDQKTNQSISKITAHNSSILGVSFNPYSTSFATCGFDGSLRHFDPKDLHSSTIFYQSSVPIQKVIFSPFQEDLIALLPYHTSRVIIVDKRSPGHPVAIVGEGDSTVNGFIWSKSKPNNLILANEDRSIYSCGLILNQIHSHCQKIAETDSPPENISNGPDIFGVVQQHSIKIFPDLK